MELSTGLLVLVALGLVAALAYATRGRWQSRGSRKRRSSTNRVLDNVDTVAGWPSHATRLLTPRQRDAFEILRKALPDYMVLTQVPVARFIRVPTRLSYSEWMRRVGNVCVDLLVCDPQSAVVAVIDVRDPDRAESDRSRKRRTRVQRVMKAAGVAHHVWSDEMLPDPTAVRKAIVRDQDHSRPSGHPPAAQGERAHYGPSSNPITIPMGDEFEDPMAPPQSSWFDELHATRPLQFEDTRPRDGSRHRR
jgi:hypothetical protein